MGKPHRQSLQDLVEMYLRGNFIVVRLFAPVAVSPPNRTWSIREMAKPKNQ